MTENSIAREVVNLCYHIHLELGPGLFESVYEEVLCYELERNAFKYTRQASLPVVWDGIELGVGFKTDIVVENKVILELKSVEELKQLHYKQLLTYLKLSDIKLGLLINFNVPLFKNGIRRVVNGLEE